MNDILNAILSKFGGREGFNKALNRLDQECKRQNINPESSIREGLNNGSISQSAFSQAAAIADAATGRKQF